MNHKIMGVGDMFDLDSLNEEQSTEEVSQENMDKDKSDKAIRSIQEAMKVKFSEEQLRIIKHSGKPLNVLSCAGSGKSTVLVAKMLYRELVSEVKPVNMLGITFNRDACGEIESRYEVARRKLGLRRGSLPTFKTFHSLFYMILRNIKGYKDYGVVQEGKYMFQLMKLIRSDGARENIEVYRDIMSYRSSLINHGISPDGLEGAVFEDVPFNEENYRKVISKYIELKEADKVLDFDDMLVFLHTELIDKGNEEATESFRHVFRDVYIDEYQDISKVQMDIMDYLILEDDRFVTIGDDDQSIYGFRGSNPSYIRDFIYRYPNAERLFLGDNYRCRADILNPVISSIEKNTVRVEKSIRAFNEGGKVVVVPIDNTFEELASVIKEDVKGMYGDDFDEIGVLVRLNAQRMLIADILAENGVQVDIGGMNYSLRANKVYMTVMGLVDAIKNEDNNKFSEFGRVMFHSLHYTVMQKYRNDKRRNWYEETITENRYNLPVYVLDSVKKIKKTNNMKNAIGYVWRMVSDYYQDLAKKGFGNFEKVIEIYRHLFQISEGLTVAQFKKSENIKESFLSLYCNSGNAVQIKTLHSVKGLEFKTVYLIGLDGQKFPNERHIERLYEKYGEEAAVKYIEEERRLFYVGWTRAESKLVISYKKDDPTRFLRELTGLHLPGVNDKDYENSESTTEEIN